MKISQIYPKVLRLSTLSLLFSWNATNLLIGMEKPNELDIEEIQQVTRYADIPEFSELLAQLCPNQLNAMRFVEDCNILHLVAFRFKTEELKVFNEQCVIEYKPLHMARLQAIKASLLLKKGGTDLLIHKNELGYTPVAHAAITGNLPVLAHFILQEPVDWLSAVQLMPVQHTHLVLNNFIEMMSIKHFYPKIETDSAIQLPLEELSELYFWAIETQEAINNRKNNTNILEKRNLKEVKYLFARYLKFDVFKHCRENPWDLHLQDLLGTLL